MAERVSDVVARLTEIASDQWGLVTTAQAGAQGVPRLVLSRLVERGVLERVVHGVYAFPAGEDHFRTLRAEWLALAPAVGSVERLDDPSLGVVSHASAAEIHGIGHLLADVPEFTLPKRKQSRRMIRTHRATLALGEVMVREGLPVTTVERTIADLYRDGHDTSHVADAVRAAMNAGALDRRKLATALGPLAHGAGHDDGGAMAEELLAIVGLDESSIGERLANTNVGRILYTSGALEGFRIAMEEVRRQVDIQVPDSVRQTLEQAALNLSQVQGFAEATTRMEAALAPTREAIAQLARDALHVQAVAELGKGLQLDRAPAAENLRLALVPATIPRKAARRPHPASNSGVAEGAGSDE